MGGSLVQIPLRTAELTARVKTRVETVMHRQSEGDYQCLLVAKLVKTGKKGFGLGAVLVITLSVSIPPSNFQSLHPKKCVGLLQFVTCGFSFKAATGTMYGETKTDIVRFGQTPSP